MKNWLFGRLTLDALPHVWYTIGGTVFIVRHEHRHGDLPDKNQTLGMALA